MIEKTVKKRLVNSVLNQYDGFPKKITVTVIYLKIGKNKRI